MKYLALKINKAVKVVAMAKSAYRMGFMLKWNNNTGRVALVNPNAEE